MKQQVLKALANPPHLFFVPYNLAVLNFVVQFLVFIVIYVVTMLIVGIDKVNDYANPLFFLISVCVVHMFLATFSKKDNQFGQILIAKIQMIARKIPRRLPA